MSVQVSTEEAALIDRAVNTADTWGIGRVSAAREAIEDAGYVWTSNHEMYMFQKYVEKKR